MLAALLAVPACAGGGAGLDHARIGFVLVGTHDDLGYNQSVWEGADAVARAFPDNEVLRVEQVPETARATKAMDDLIRRGVRIVFATSFGYYPYALDVARRHPGVFVLWQGERHAPAPNLPNFGTYWGTVAEPVYLAGIAAGAVTRSGTLGFVAGFANPATYANADAFTMGAQRSNPEVVTRIVFTGSWCDPSRQRQAAEQLLAAGADVLTQHQDCTRTVLETAERAGAYSVGYHADGSEVTPGGWLVGSAWTWGQLMTDMVDTILRGDFAASSYHGDFRGDFSTEDNPLVLTELSPLVPRAAVELIGAERRRLEAGGSPFVGPIVDRDGRVRVPAGRSLPEPDIDSVDWFVKGVVGDAPGA